MYGSAGHSGQAKRGADPEDLEQEGYIALQNAIESFDETRGVSFKTYAYRLIYRAMARYLGNTCSVISTGRVTQDEEFYSQRTFQLMKDALRYRLFTELEREGPGGYRIRFDRPDEEADPALVAEREEFILHCIDKLKEGLSVEDWDVLMRRMEGETYPTIAETLGCTPEYARRIFNDLVVRCQIILYDEGVQLHESDLSGNAI